MYKFFLDLSYCRLQLLTEVKQEDNLIKWGEMTMKQLKFMTFYSVSMLKFNSIT